jgi:topoisomerase IV subunit A
LRKLEEMELRRERDDLMKERAALEDLLGKRTSCNGPASRMSWRRFRQAVRQGHDPGRAPHPFAEAGVVEDVPIESMIEREPITVICSRMGWIRAMKGHQPLDAEVKYKDGDEGCFLFHAETTDRILLVGSNGRFYTLLGANLPGGRGMGEPVRLMVDLPNEAGIVALTVWKPGEKLLLASSAGDGFLVPSDEVLAQTRAGKAVMNLADDAHLVACRVVRGDHVAVVSKNRKLLVFPLSELPEMGRGKGVRLQKYLMAKGRQGVLELDGGLSDITTFRLAEGLAWQMPNGQTRRETGIADWIARRATMGKAPPHGFPRDNRFT